MAEALRRPSVRQSGDLTKANPTHYFWKELITKHRMPFLKVELLRDNPAGIDISGWEEVVKSCSNYNVDLIKRHLARVKQER